MPPCKLERLRVFPRQFVANVGKFVGLSVTAKARVVAAQPYLYSDNEIQLLPTKEVGSVVCHICFGCGQAAGVLV